ncbi:MAG TPA: TRAP transporter substrate-binding protein [Candidatus Baltobacteraceae bacterium]|nr:TRAP transporter substrate-binding protein [Candidatus Baltobacteraceae bacterium]
MKRLCSAVTLVMLVLAAAQANAQTVTLRYAHMNAPSSIAGQQATMLAKAIEEKTKGAVKVQVFPASQLGTLQEQAEAVSQGSVQIHHNTMAGIGSLYEPFGALDTPYMYKDVQHLMRVADPNSPVMKRLGEGLLKARGVRVFYTFYFGTRQLTADRQVLNPKDLQGVKIRAIPFPMYMAAVEGMGAVATPVDFAELATQLATKAVNGQENPVDTIFANKFFETQSHLMLTGHIMGAELVVFNDAAWKKLSPTLQGQIMEAANEVSKKATQMTLESDAAYTKQLAEKGMKVIGPKEGLDLEAFRSRVQAEVSKRFDTKFGDLYKEIRTIQ